MRDSAKQQWLLESPASSENEVEEQTHPDHSRLAVGFILVPEFTLMAFSGFIEALRHAADEWDRSRQIHCSWTVLGHDLSPVKASCGVEIMPWETLRDPREFDYLVVVGGLTRGHEQIHPSIETYLKRAARENVALVGLCTGSFVLARAGLMNGHRCCVHWFHMEEFEAKFPNVNAESDTLFLIDHNRITCAGGGGAVDLAILLIERHLGRDKTLKCINQMVVDEIRRHNHPQSRLGHHSYSNVRNPMVRRAILMMEHHICDSLPVSRIAQELGTSTRILERAFVAEVGKPPARFARELRLSYGRWLLEHSSKSVTQIALECSFSDASHFAKCFRRTFGYAPLDVRSRIA
jgi:transcriptional regulator GlxA family with amidase domain